MVQSKEVMHDIVEWDVYNWSRAVNRWSTFIDFTQLKGKKVLALGERRGGLSLLFALAGADVLCTDLDFVKTEKVEQTKELHKKYGVEDKISYKDIDATDIPYTEYFDIVCFKSVMGGVGHNDHYECQEAMMKSIYNALKKEGVCCFAENLVGSGLVTFLRKKFRPWGSSWRYITIEETERLVSDFEVLDMRTFGVIGLLGRGRILSYLLGILDRLFEMTIHNNGRYIVSCTCKKC